MKIALGLLGTITTLSIGILIKQAIQTRNYVDKKLFDKHGAPIYMKRSEINKKLSDEHDVPIFILRTECEKHQKTCQIAICKKIEDVKNDVRDIRADVKNDLREFNREREDARNEQSKILMDIFERLGAVQLHIQMAEKRG